VVALPSETIDDARLTIMRLGRTLGLERQAMAYRARFDEALVRARAGAVGKRRPRVLMVYARDAGQVANISAAGPGSFLDELIRYAGGRNILEDLEKAYADVRVETVLRREPEVIIDASAGGAAADWQELRTVPAVRDGRVHMAHGALFLVPGPRLPEAVRRLVDFLHGRP
jgi:iron complex transport system substrate-binding protein